MNKPIALGKREQEWVVSMLPTVENIVKRRVFFGHDDAFQEACVCLCERSLRMNWEVPSNYLQRIASFTIRNGIKRFFRKKRYGWGWGVQEEVEPTIAYFEEEPCMVSKEAPSDIDLKNEFNTLWNRLSKVIEKTMVEYYTTSIGIQLLAKRHRKKEKAIHSNLRRGRNLLREILREHTCLEGGKNESFR